MVALDSEVEPWIAVNPTNPDNLVATWQQDRWTNAGARGHGVAVSFDGGETWLPLVIPGLTLCSGGVFQRASDPWLSFGPEGDLYHIALSGSNPFQPGGRVDVVVSKSNDGGLTWGDPVTISESTDPSFNDKQTLTADPTDDRFVYAVWARLHDQGGGATLVARSTDGGDTWEPERIVADPPSPTFSLGHQIVVLPDGTLVMLMLERDSGVRLAIKRSIDKGTSWVPAGDPMPVLDVGQPAVAVTDLQLIRAAEINFDVAVDRTTRDLYAVWQDKLLAGGPPLPAIAFSVSSDGGLTWSGPTSIAKTPPNLDPFLEQSLLPSVHVSDDGVVGVTYYDFRNDSSPSEILTDYWFIYCDPSRRDCTHSGSWEHEIRLTEEPFDFLTAPLAGATQTVGLNLFLGDYVGLASAGSDFLALFPQSSPEDPATVFFSRIQVPELSPGVMGAAALGSLLVVRRRHRGRTAWSPEARRNVSRQQVTGATFRERR
jgi:hypothetical protein